LARGNTARHDRILEALTRQLAISLPKKYPSEGWSFSVDKTCVQSSALRPDLVCINPSLKLAFIIDVTCPFEHSSNSLNQAKAVKIQRYSAIAQVFSSQGFRVVLDALVVGAMGAWLPSNDSLLLSCGILSHQLIRFKRSAIASSISSSCDIYKHHIMALPTHAMQAY
jgi:hypothetical protein